MTERFSPQDLEALMDRALQRAGATPAMAAATAAALVAAELEGIPSHGASRIPQYCGHVRNGRATGGAVPRIARDNGGACLVDAGGGLAFEACSLAVREAIARARRHGVSFVSVTNSNHFGVAAFHAEPIAAAGLVGLAFGNSPGAMPMWGGKRALFGTNPIAAAFPRRHAAPIVVDMSLSEVARGKLMVAAREGKAIPPGWALDKDGNPTTDPKAGLEGLMLPAGGAKGAMLALTVELLVCALGGAAFGSSPTASSPRTAGPRASARPSSPSTRTRSPAARCSSSAWRRWSPRCCKDAGVRLPGGRRANRARHAAEGIALPPDLAAKIRALAGEG